MIRSILFLLLLLVALNPAHAEDDLGEGEIVRDVSQSMAGEDIFQIGSGGMSPGLQPASREGAAAMALGSTAAGGNGSLASVDLSASLGQSAPALPEEATGLAGSWHIILGEEMEADLNLHQVGLALFGSGMLAHENASEEITASGILDGQDLQIDLVTLSGQELYRLNLTIINKTLEGSFKGFSSEGPLGDGEAIGAPIPYIP
jgi:hypothetical protein